MTAELIPARLGHILSLERRVRDETKMLERHMAPDSMHAAARMFRNSRYAKALRIDGRVYAAYGIIGALLTPKAMLWLMVDPAIWCHIRVFVRTLRAEFDRLKRDEPGLYSLVITDDAIGCRFAEHWGFRLGEPLPLGFRMAELREAA